MKTPHVLILKYARPVVLVFQLQYVQGCKELSQLWVEDVRGGENILFFKCGLQVNPITKQKIHLRFSHYETRLQTQTRALVSAVVKA